MGKGQDICCTSWYLLSYHRMWEVFNIYNLTLNLWGSYSHLTAEKLRYREFTELIQMHLTDNWWSQNLISCQNDIKLLRKRKKKRLWHYNLYKKTSQLHGWPHDAFVMTMDGRWKAGSTGSFWWSTLTIPPSALSTLSSHLPPYSSPLLVRRINEDSPREELTS